MPKRRGLVLAVLLGASAAFLIYSLRSMRPLAGPGAEGRVPAGSAEGEGPTAVAMRPAAPDDVKFSRYEELANRNIFAERGAKPAATQQTGGKKAVAASALPPVFPPPEKKLNLGGWSYVGYVALDGKRVGILLQEGSGRCEYVPEGGKFLGAKAEDMNHKRIRFSFDSSETTLSRERDFSVLPLQQGVAPAPRATPMLRTGPR